MNNHRQNQRMNSQSTMDFAYLNMYSDVGEIKELVKERDLLIQRQAKEIASLKNDYSKE
jgi:hypothetical protein